MATLAATLQANAVVQHTTAELKKHRFDSKFVPLLDIQSRAVKCDTRAPADAESAAAMNDALDEERKAVAEDLAAEVKALRSIISEKTKVIGLSYLHSPQARVPRVPE